MVAHGALERDHHTIENRVWIGSRVQGRARELAPSISHAAEVATLEPVEQERWLERAQTEGWSQRDLRMELRAARRRLVLEGQAVLEGQYRVVLADPPWVYRDAGATADGSLGKVALHYQGLSIEELCRLPVAAHTTASSVLFLWVTAPMLYETPGPREVIAAWGFCCGVGTRVLTHDLHWQAAETVTPGDALLGFDEQPTGNRRYYRPTQVIANGVRDLPAVRMTLSDGRQLMCSETHPWLVRAGSAGGKLNRMRWLTAMEIAKLRTHHNRRNPLTLPKLAPLQEPERSYEAGYLAAAFDGEGTIRTGKLRLMFAQKPNAMLQQVEAFLRSAGFDISRHSYDYASAAETHILGGYEHVFRFLMRYRPVRLMDRWLNDEMRKLSIYNKVNDVAIVDVERIGKWPCATLTTSSGTYIAEGFGAHNTPKTGMVWHKRRHNWGHYVSVRHEHVILATRGSCLPDRPTPMLESVFTSAKLPQELEHSEKPEELRTMIERLYDGPYLELFGRRRVAGWTVYGNDARLWTGEAQVEERTPCERS